VIECEPTASVVVVSAAVPPESVPVPIFAAPSLNVTVPVAVPAPGATAATVAVNVTDCPELDGFVPLVSVVVVLAWFTVCETALDVLAPKIDVPAYEAVRLCEPAVRFETGSVATPDAFRVPVPKVVPPSLNVTVPAFGVVGPVVAVTVAINVVLCPNRVGFTELVRATEVDSALIVIPNVPVLAFHCVFPDPPPAYPAVIVPVPPEVALNVLLQVEVLLAPVMSVQEARLKFPKFGEILQLTVPLGEPLLPPVSFTVAVHVVEVVAMMFVELQETTVDVLSFASVNVFCA